MWVRVRVKFTVRARVSVRVGVRVRGRLYTYTHTHTNTHTHTHTHKLSLSLSLSHTHTHTHTHTARRLHLQRLADQRRPPQTPRSPVQDGRRGTSGAEHFRQHSPVPHVRPGLRRQGERFQETKETETIAE